MSIVFRPYLSKYLSTLLIAFIDVSFSTPSLPAILAIRKHNAAPAMALVQERIAPFHQPNIAAFANVMRNAGSGAATDWNTIRPKEIAAAYGPYERINPMMLSTLADLNSISICVSFCLNEGIV